MKVSWALAILASIFCQHTVAQQTIGVFRSDYETGNIVKKIFEENLSGDWSVSEIMSHESPLLSLCNKNFDAVILSRFKIKSDNESQNEFTEEHESYCDENNIYQMEIARVNHVLATERKQDQITSEGILDIIYSQADDYYQRSSEIENIHTLDETGRQSLLHFLRTECSFRENCSEQFNSQKIQQAIENIADYSMKKSSIWHGLYNPRLNFSEDALESDELFWITDYQATQTGMTPIAGAGINGQTYISTVSVLMNEEIAEQLMSIDVLSKSCPSECDDDNACPQSSIILAAALCCDDDNACPQNTFGGTWEPINVNR